MANITPPHFLFQLSIPHSGPEAPAELRGRIVIDKYDLHDDIDPFTRQIYDLGEKVKAVVTTNIARTFIDVNRAPDDRPPQNPDGVVKSMTCLGRPIYLADQEPDEQLMAELLRCYYHPYHDQIEKAFQSTLNFSIRLYLCPERPSRRGPLTAI
jgi:formiminoglutamase